MGQYRFPLSLHQARLVLLVSIVHHVFITAKAFGITWTFREQLTGSALYSHCQRNKVGAFPRQDIFRWIGAVACGAVTGDMIHRDKVAMAADMEETRAYFQRFPTLFAPLYGNSSRTTIKRKVGDNIWILEQNLELGPLQTPVRCVVVRLKNGRLWVHAPLAPTEEFFDLVESCADSLMTSKDSVAHIVAPTYALEHKVFVKDAIKRWPDAKLWTSPGQFSFPLRSVPDAFVWGKNVDGVLDHSDQIFSTTQIPWIDEIQFESLPLGTFKIGTSPQTFYETAFYHKSSRTLLVTDAVAKIPLTSPELNDPQRLLLISKRSTADAFPADTPEARQIGYEKSALLVSYFFPEHEELDPDSGFGVVTWSDGWHDNFLALAGRLIVPPVVRTLLYPQDPGRVSTWVKRVTDRWDFEQIVPAHWEAPVAATPPQFLRAFSFLESETVDPFPENDLARGLRPIAGLLYKTKRKVHN